MRKTTFSVALGGLIAALSIILMFFTSFTPLLVYSLPALSGILLVSVMIESGTKWAFATYFAVAVLSFFLTPDKEAVVLFVMFLGYYPIVKCYLEKVKVRVIEWILKLLVFNVAIVVAYKIIITVFGLKDVLDGINDFGQYGMLLFLLAGNVVFVIYDIAVTSLITSYINWFRPKFLRKLK